MRVASLDARDFRSLERIEVEIGPGITTALGANGTGKTNLLEALYFGLSGRSFRTRDRRELIRFGSQVARSELVVEADGSSHTLLASVSRGEGRRHLLDGDAASPETISRHRPHLVVFSPDRLILVKGPPAERRAHIDGFVAARWPSRAGLRQTYGQVLAQRNALLRRVAAGLAPPAELDAWDGALAAAAVPLIEARAGAAGELAPRFAEAAAELGLADAAPALRAAQRGRRGAAARRAPGAPRVRPAPRPDLAGPAPGRARPDPRSAARCAAMARRASSAPACWRCCSRSARR